MSGRAWLADLEGAVVGETAFDEDAPPERLEHQGRKWVLLEERPDGSAVYLEDPTPVDHTVPHGLCMTCLARGVDPPVAPRVEEA